MSKEEPRRSGERQKGRFKGLTLTAFLIVLTLVAAACSDGTAEPASTPDAEKASDAGDTDTSSVRSQANGDGPESLALCFANSIDAVGRGSLDAGVAGFDECLAEDYVFEFQDFPGGPSTVCPGDGCPVQDFSSLGEMRAVFADGFFVNSGYIATQHQVLNVDVEQNGDQAEVVAYIQAQHFLPDNSVDIAWNDYSYTAVLEDDVWKMDTETIVGTAFLNFQGSVVGGGGDVAPLSSVGEVTMRNTLQDPGADEATFPSLFGQADDAYDEFASISADDVEFPTALSQDGTPAGDLNGLYSIDLAEGSIAFEVVADPDDPFWSGVFGLFPEGKVDRYYFTFDQPHGATDFTSDNPNLNVRIDSETELVVELMAGYDLQPGVNFTVELS